MQCSPSYGAAGKSVVRRTACYSKPSRLACLPVRSRAPEERRQAKKIAIFVEPSPFSHISGMKNRFECLIKGLREEGDDVMVVTPDPQPPKDFFGAKVVNVLGFKLPFYKSPTLLLSIGLSVRVLWYLLRQRPDIIHVSTPGILVFSAVLYARLLRVPLIMSYHTHIPDYIPKYTWKGLVQPMWSIIRWCTRRADLTLVTSRAMKEELTLNRCRIKSLDVWQRGVDTEVFNPKYRSVDMRRRMTGGHVDAPLLVYVGRLGAEKNLKVLRGVLEANPTARLAFVGDGPEADELKDHFAGYPVQFMGMMKGLDLSAAYASADIFVMPSETETLGFVVLEAMAAGLAVVAVAAGGLTDIITQPGTTGLLYEPGNYQQAAEHVQRLIADPQLLANVAAAGRREVERWGWKAATRKIREQQYSRAIKLAIYKRRFWWLWVRMGLLHKLRVLWLFITGAFKRTVKALDYARDFRSPVAAA